MICDALATVCTEAVPAVAQGPQPIPVWVYLLVLACVLLPLLYGLLTAAGRQPRPKPPTTVYRCAGGVGRDRCTAPATRVVLMITTTPMESRVMCDQDAQRYVRIGRAIDLGTIRRAV